MQKPEIEETHLRHIMLFLFDKGLKSKEAMQTICDVYGDIVKLQKCSRWLNMFKSGDRKLMDKPKIGRPQKIDDDTLNSLVESDPRKKNEELSH